LNGAINELTAIEGQLYKRFYIDVKLVEKGNSRTAMITYGKKYRLTYLAKS
jgi:hypothetical protein